MAQGELTAMPGKPASLAIPPAALVTTQAREMAAALSEGGALLGLDLGTQTIGTAFCDAGWRIASPGKTLKRGKFTLDKQTLTALIAERCVRGIVIGLPLKLWDERWSTTSAERGLIEQDMSRAKRAIRIDSAAAAVILQAAIDALAGNMLP